MAILKILAVLAILIIAARWLDALINLLTGHPKPGDHQKNEGEISILISARNEALNLAKLLNGLIKCDNSIGKIIIYNDQSEDETAAEVEL
jgi:cellulose synthase/poly-beta-1,6-N-acetylglucosamine synthase-like glycosyltransferase